MHRPGWYRAMLALWGLWFTTALTEPAGIMACTMHGARPVAAHGGHADARPAASTARERDAAPASSHAAHVADAHDSNRPASVESSLESSHAAVPASDTDGHECCTCLGLCCAATTAPPPPQAIALSTAAVRAAPARDFSRRERASSPRAYVLPFANAPPARRA